jgi:hypothetical protein
MKNIGLVLILASLSFSQLAAASTIMSSPYDEADYACNVSDIVFLGMLKVPFDNFFGSGNENLMLEVLVKTDPENPAIWLSKNRGEEIRAVEDFDLKVTGRSDSYEYHFYLDPQDGDSYLRGNFSRFLTKKITHKIRTEKFGRMITGAGTCLKLRN